MIEIVEPTSRLIEISQSDDVGQSKALYAPVSADDRIDFDSRYWDTKPRNTEDIELCSLGAFAFDHNDQDCLELPTYYAELDIPETATEFRAQNTLAVFEAQVYGLLSNGASLEEARRFAMAAVTGLPSTFSKKT